MFVVFFAFIALSFASDPKPCLSCTDCAKCLSQQAIPGTFTKKVAISLSDCKGSDISWFCCRSSSGSLTSSSCEVSSCDGNMDRSKNKCDEASQVTYTVPYDATELTVRIKLDFSRLISSRYNFTMVPSVEMSYVPRKVVLSTAVVVLVMETAGSFPAKSRDLVFAKPPLTSSMIATTFLLLPSVPLTTIVLEDLEFAPRVSVTTENAAQPTSLESNAEPPLDFATSLKFAFRVILPALKTPSVPLVTLVVMPLELAMSLKLAMVILTIALLIPSLPLVSNVVVRPINATFLNFALAIPLTVLRM